MAVQEGLIVTFRGDTAPMTKSLGDLQDQLKRFQTTLQSATDPSSIARLNRAIEATGDRIKKIQSFKGLNEISKGSNRATAALTDLSRVAQDAPYGFIGIANNLNPLFESFQRLRAESGSNAGALKALVTGLTGPAGVGLALGVVSSLLVKYGDKLFNSKTQAEQNAEAIKKQRDALKDYVDSLGDVAKVRLLGAQNAQEELVKLQSIYAASQNTNLSYTERKKAVDALQEQYPKYFANLKDEAILAGQGRDAYDKLTTAILASARARAAQDQLVDIQKQLLSIESKRAEARSAEVAASNKVIQAKKDEIALQGRVIGGGTVQAPLTNTSALTSQQNLNTKQKETNELTKQWVDLNKRAATLVGEINKNVAENGVASLIGDSKEKLTKTKPEFNFFDKFFDFDYNSSNLKAKQQDELLKAARDFQKEFGSIFKGLDFYKGTEESSLNAARAWWANFNKGILEFKHDAFANIDFKVDIPVVVTAQKVGLEDYLDTLKGQFEKGTKGFVLPDFGTTQGDINRKALLDQYTKAFNWVGKQLPKQVKLDNGLVKDIDAITSLDQLKEGLDNTLGYAQQQLQTIADMVNGVLSPAFSNLFNAILAGEDPLKSFFDGIGQSVIQLINQLIQAAVQAMILSIFTGGAAGGGMSFTQAFSKVTGLASGGIIPGGYEGDKFPAMLNSGEAVIPLDKLHKFIAPENGGASVDTIRLRGDVIELQRNRTQRKQRRLR